MSIQEEVLAAARALCSERKSSTFTPDEVVRALPHLNAASVRTHISSRCCVNAPKHHSHRWAYFRRLERGTYEILPRYRRQPERKTTQVHEEAATYGTAAAAARRGVVHAICHREGRFYVAECAEIAVVTQGRSLDDLASNLREAVSLHLDGGDAALLGMEAKPRIVLTYEMEGPEDAS